MQSVRNLLAALVSILYPKRCPSCKTIVDPEEDFCASCLRHAHPIATPLCACCGMPFPTEAGPDHLCGSCLTEPPPFRRARAWAYYQYGTADLQPVSAAIQQFKYHRDLSVGKTLATLAATHYPFTSESYDVIVPVPLHLTRLRWRGFNQALVLARAIGTTHHIPVDPFLLDRIRPTVPQTELTGKERRTNVHGAFSVAIPTRVKDKRILLVDDVYTSGATVHECAATLMHAGVELVDVFTVARAVG